MPTVVLNVNVPSDNVSDLDVAKKLSSIAANRTGKPESYVMTQVNSGAVMTFGGTDAPCAFVRFVSLGSLNSETNASISSDTCALLTASYGVQPNRTYIEFVDIKERFMFGWNGSTF